MGAGVAGPGAERVVLTLLHAWLVCGVESVKHVEFVVWSLWGGETCSNLTRVRTRGTLAGLLEPCRHKLTIFKSLSRVSAS